VVRYVYDIHFIFPPDQCGVVLVALFRDPVEKLISQLYFFHEFFKKLIYDVKDRIQESSAWMGIDKLVSDPKNISAEEMNFLLDTVTHYSTDPNLLLNEYETVMSRTMIRPFRNTPVTLSRALVNLNRDIAVVGISENMPSMFVLLALDLRMKISSTCNRHVTHNVEKKYLSIFNSTTRPAPEKLFSLDTLRVLHERCRSERILYNQAIRIHEQLLLNYGLNISSASNIWKTVCG